MLNLKPELREGETVLGEYGATVYLVSSNYSSRGSNIRLWLTTQRLILKSVLAAQRTLPLYAIANIREEKICWYTMVRLEFANGHLEWMTVQNQAQFLELLKSTQAQAPEIPEAITPGKLSPVFTGLFGGGLVFMAIIAAFTLLCMGAFVALFIALQLIMMRAH
jgi:hypothetical protein